MYRKFISDRFLIILDHFVYCYRPGGIPARNAKGERLLLFVGIIDILQSYRLKKKLEHTWKSMIHDGVSNLYVCMCVYVYLQVKMVII